MIQSHRDSSVACHLFVTSTALFFLVASLPFSLHYSVELSCTIMSNSYDSASHHIIPDLNSNDGKVMLAALISLIIVLSFILLLHVYARWFLGQPRRRLRRRPVSHVSGLTHLHTNLNSLVYEDFQTGFGADGLDVSSIAKIPLFIYKSDEEKNGLECAICLSVFEEDEIGRLLPKCQHSFHVECVDMWLQWRSNCPICRATVAPTESLNEVRVPESIGTTISIESTGTVLHESFPLEAQIEMPIDSSLECQVPKHSAVEMPIDSSLECQGQKHSAAAVPSGCSLKRMLSMNRSEQYWVFPSSSTSN